ncbi:MAG: AAA family ATPase [Oscillospiraceae bacterium]|jgi:GTPase SAR1 family protein|nr:AAA family ATPase [Oscillospiraceae bacterium]
MQITKGLICGALKCCVYGPEGIGKSTFASQFPDPVFIDTEGSTKFMDVARTPTPSSWAMLIDQVQYFRSHPKECRTLVIDTADWAEALCLSKICAEKRISGIEDLGYGKGYIYLEEEFGRLLNLLEDLVKAGINVVLTAHAQMRKFEQPDELGAYDRWELKLEKKTAALVKEWVDLLLFANYKTLVVNVDGQGTAKGRNKPQGGKRVMYTAHHPCWDAKNRHMLEPEVPFEFEQISHLFDMVVRPAEVVSPEPPVQTAPAPEPPAQKVPPEAPAQSDEPAQKAVFTEIPSDTPHEGDYEGIPRGLLDLMHAAKISPYEVQAAVAKKGYFPSDMPIKNYPLDFINGVLISAWPQIRKFIESNPDRLPF